MNTPGVKVSSNLAKVMIGFIVLVIVGVFIWPHLWPAKASVPEIPVTKFAEPPRPIAAPIPKLIPMVHAQASPTPQARPTPCQSCIEAANEVLTRYLHAIRTGAGADNREEQRNVYESPQTVPNTNPPVWKPTVPGNEQFHL
jgi:cell division septation protein DedD